MNCQDWIVLIVLLVMLAGGIVIGAQGLIALIDQLNAPCEAPEATGWEPPKLQLCPKDMELWDCIRDAKYRSDI